MSNIKFIEFASKWRKKLVPNQVKGGKELRKIFATNQNNNVVFEKSAENRKLLEDTYKSKLKKQGRESREKYKINKDPVTNTSLDNRIYKSNKVSLSATGKAKLKILKDAYKNRKKIASINKVKSFIGKNKLSLGLAGAAVTGAVSYSVYRKLRSDKGKKRRRYLNNGNS